MKSGLPEYKMKHIKDVAYRNLSKQGIIYHKLLISQHLPGYNNTKETMHFCQQIQSVPNLCQAVLGTWGTSMTKQTPAPSEPILTGETDIRQYLMDK